MPFKSDEVIAALLATGTAPDQRIEIEDSEVRFYTGDVHEVAPGSIVVDVGGNPDPALDHYGEIIVTAPDLGGSSPAPQLSLRSRAVDGSAPPAAAITAPNVTLGSPGLANNIRISSVDDSVRVVGAAIAELASSGNTSVSGGNVTVTTIGNNGDVTITASDDVTLQSTNGSGNGRVVVAGPDFSVNTSKMFRNGMAQPQIQRGTSVGTASGAGGRITVAHSLGVVPTHVFVTFRAGHLTTAVYWDQAASTSTTFDLVFTLTTTGAAIVGTVFFFVWDASYTP